MTRSFFFVAYLSVFLSLLCFGISGSTSLTRIKGYGNNHAVRSNEVVKVSDDIWVALVTVGTPPKNFSVQLDTGSTNMAIYSSQCAACPGVNSSINLYSPTASSTSSEISCSNPRCVTEPLRNKTCTSGSCTAGTTYGDLSYYSGKVYSDTVTIAGITATNVLFSTADQASSGFEAPSADGIIGLAYPDLDFPTSPIDSITGQNDLTNVFYIGLVADGTGSLTVGPPDSSLFIGSFQTIPVIPTYMDYYALYAVAASSVSVGNVQVGTSSDWDLVFVDSGTTLLYVPTAVYGNVITQLKITNPYCLNTFIYGLSCKMTEDQINQYPTMTWTFGSVSITIKPIEYLLYDEETGKRFFGIGDSGGTSVILGDPFMIGRYIGFDKTNNNVLIATSSVTPSFPPDSTTTTSNGFSLSASISSIGVYLIALNSFSFFIL